MKQIEQKVIEYCKELLPEYNEISNESSTWNSRKVLQKMFEKIDVNLEDLQKIKNLQKTSQNPILIVPTRKSLMDLIILDYTAAKLNLIKYSNKNKISKYGIFNECFKIKIIKKIHKNEVRRTIKSRKEGTIDEYVCLHRWN